MADALYDRVNDYGSVKIQLASPNDIRSWSFGEVKKPETINYRTYRAEKDGLFCERIFGPERDWECSCGKYKGTKYKGIICDRCGVKVTHSRVRRKRMGHINLAAPIVHIWFFKALPSRLGAMLDMKTSDIEKVIYFQDYVVTDPGKTPLKRKALLTEEEYRAAYEKYPGEFEVEMGAEAIKKLLMAMNLETEQRKVRDDIEKTNSKQKLKDLTKRLKMIEAIRGSQNKAEWMVMDVIPVIPPDLRPLVLLESGNFATSDLNDLYRRIINRNNRLKKLVDLNAPEVIIRNEKRMLQQAVDALFDNGRCRRPVLGSSNRPLKSLTDMIKGKQGRFRENLLGKRVDYSARSVIVVGPELKLHQCGLPKKIALELFQPFIIRKLKEHGLADTIKSAKRMLERRDQEVWDILEEVIYQHPVMLNRAPTLHRMGIQAFEPVLVEGNAIKIHPLVCKGFNADFDGDQMAVHLPLSLEAQAETHVLMLAPHNIFSPANGSPIISPSQDIVLGSYYITVDREGDKGEFSVFNSTTEAIMAFDLGKIAMHSRIFVRQSDRTHVVPDDKSQPTPINEIAFKHNEEHRKRLDAAYANAPMKSGFKSNLILTTVGRCMFNDILPLAMPFYNYGLTARGLSRVIADTYAVLGRPATIDLLDKMKELGFKRSTLAALSFGITDVRSPDTKAAILDEGQKQADKIEKAYRQGAITDQERYNQLIEIWSHCREKVATDLMTGLESDYRDAGGLPVTKEEGKAKGYLRYLNPITMMIGSGARGNKSQMQQLGGMRGLMAKPSGEMIETPIKSNFREGLSVLEYFSSTHGARKGLADTALKTADSGYLTRKLCDVAQNVMVQVIDCGTVNGVAKSTVYKGETIEVPLEEMIVGRTARDTIRNPITDETIVTENQTITLEMANKLKELKLESTRVRSPLTCESGRGVCARCYGVDMSSGKLVEEGLAVGIIAAQSIGEPGTQLTMRTFHTGGVGTSQLIENDIKTSVGGIVEHRDINAVDVIDPDGTKRLVALKRNGELAVVDAKGRELEKFKVPYAATILIPHGGKVKAREQLVVWDPHITAILAEKSGFVKYEDIEEGETVRLEEEKKEAGKKKLVVTEHKGERHPRITIVGSDGKILDFHYLPSKARIEVEDGEKIQAGQLLARQPKEAGGTVDITTGLPRVTELFEARKPKDPSVLAEISGTIELRSDRRRGKMTIIVRNETGMEREHHVPQDKELLVHTGDAVEAGDPLIRGPVIPHDILRIRGEEALHGYLLTEVQNVYRSQGVKINDKHIEVILAQMLRKIKIDDNGDTRFLPGEVADKFRFRRANEEVSGSYKILEPGDTELKEGDLVERAVYREANEAADASGKEPAKGKKPRPARGKTLLLGITKASLSTESFLSAASFQETTKVLTEAAMAGAVDTLSGLKENVILGHLIPAGTAFNPHLNLVIKKLVEAEPYVEEPIRTPPSPSRPAPEIAPQVGV
ncbi:MAG TPA: DNA-directed RNA polymerase subunit beta' [Tepidisphaeraceae bacterium]|jgi:DNA-directed RNA polymerase subunit beta'